MKFSTSVFKYGEIFVPVLSRVAELIPEGIGKPGHVYTVANGTNGMMGLFKFEVTIPKAPKV